MRTDIFSVELDKITKDRPRVTRRGHAFTPKATVDAERKICAAWKKLCGDKGKFIDGQPLSIRICAEIQIPKSRLNGKNKVENDRYHVERRGDVDNIAKLVLDALNGTAYEDDCQVSQIFVVKKWCLAKTCLSVSVYELYD